MAHKQKFKDPLSSTCQVSSERRVLGLELEVNQRPMFSPHWGNILLLDVFFVFFLLALLPMLHACEKLYSVQNVLCLRIAVL